MRPRQPLGLAWISAVLRKEGHHTKLIDMSILEKDTSNIIEGTTHLIITSSPLDRWETPYLDLSTFYTLIKNYKKIGSKVIVTGPHGTVTPDLLLDECPEIDIIMRGEAEETVKDLFKNFDNLENILGISFRKDGKNIHNPARPLIEDLNTLPLPDYEQLPMDKYVYGDALPGPFTIMESSRGCPYQCVFCLKAMHGGRKYRVRTPENIIHEIEYLQKNFGIKSIYFQDLEFTILRPRVHTFCDLMIEKGITLNWSCASRVNDADEKMFAHMKEAGCKSISFGVESMAPEVLKKTKKGTTPEMIKNAYDICQKTGINFNAFYTQGHPGETKETMAESLKQGWKMGIPHPLDRGAKIIPYPGTELYERAKEQGLIKDGTWEEVANLRGKVETEEGYDQHTLKSLYYFGRIRLQQKK